MKRLLAVTLTTAVLTGVTGCGGSKGGPASSAAPTATVQEDGGEMAETTTPEIGREPTAVTFWHRDGNTISDPICAEVIKDLQERYPWITVEYTGLASDSYTQRFNTAAVMESTPDVGMINDKNLYALVVQGALMQLDDVFNAWEGKDNLFPSIVEQARLYAQGGNLYLLGYGKTQETSWCNTGWREEKGIELTGPVADLKTYCEEHAEDGMHYFSPRDGSGSAEDLSMFILFYGGERAFFNEDGTSTLNNPKVMGGLGLYANLYKDGLVSHDAISSGYREMVVELGAGTAQYIMHSSSFVSEHTKNLGEGGFLPIRPLEGGDEIAVCKTPTSMGPAVFKNTERPEGAILLAEYPTSAEGAGYVNRNEDRVPIDTSIYDQGWYEEDPYFQIYAEFKNDPDLVSARSPIYPDGYAEYMSNDIIADLQVMMMGDRTAQEACDKWAASLTRLQQEWMADQPDCRATYMTNKRDYFRILPGGGWLQRVYMKRTTEYRQTRLSFSRAVICGLGPIPQKEVFYDTTGGPFIHTKVEFLMEFYNKEGTAGIISCTSLTEERLLPLASTGEERMFEEWNRFLYWRCRNSGLAGKTVREAGRFEFVLLDPMSRRAGLPAHRFLGPDKNWIPVYGGGGGTHLEGLSLAEEIEGFLSYGHRIVKMKVGTDLRTRLDRDVERTELTRGVIGPDVGLALDASQVFTAGWTLEFAKRMEEYNIARYEEPLHSLDYFSYRDLVEQCLIPVFSGESFYNHCTFQPLLETKMRHFQPITASFDGIEDWFRINAMAEECDAVISSDGLPMLSAVMIVGAGENAMVEFLESCDQPLLDYMDIRVGREDGRFYFPDAAGLSRYFDMGRLDKKGFLKSKKIVGT